MIPQPKPPAQPPPPYATHIQQGWEALGTEGVTGPGGQSSWAGRQHTVHLKRWCDRALGFPRGDLAVKTAGAMLGLCLSFYCFCPEPLQQGRGRHREVGTPATCLRPLSASLLSSL